MNVTTLRRRRWLIAPAVVLTAGAIGFGVNTVANAAPPPVAAIPGVVTQARPEPPGPAWVWEAVYDSLEACYDGGATRERVIDDVDTYICIPFAGWHLFLHYTSYEPD